MRRFCAETRREFNLFYAWPDCRESDGSSRRFCPFRFCLEQVDRSLRHLVTLGRLPDGKHQWEERPGRRPFGEDQNRSLNSLGPRAIQPAWQLRNSYRYLRLSLRLIALSGVHRSAFMGGDK
jgi:hypothetical protein